MDQLKHNENWQLDFEWLQVRHKVKTLMQLDKLPDLNGILFLIGVQEYGRPMRRFSKEEKQDLMHIAVCELLTAEGVYAFVGRDADGWPHYEQRTALPTQGVAAQETLLKQHIVRYFAHIDAPEAA